MRRSTRRFLRELGRRARGPVLYFATVAVCLVGFLVMARSCQQRFTGSDAGTSRGVDIRFEKK